MKNLQLISVNRLIDDEFQEHMLRSKQEERKVPMPFNQYNSKIFIVEKFATGKNVLFEVDWIFSIK